MRYLNTKYQAALNKLTAMNIPEINKVIGNPKTLRQKVNSINAVQNQFSSPELTDIFDNLRKQVTL